MTNNDKEKLRAIIRDRKVAYSMVFGDNGPPSRAVMADLQAFCRGNESTFHPDSRVHALLEGRREVILRILDHVTLSVDELCNKYGGRKDHGG